MRLIRPAIPGLLCLLLAATSFAQGACPPSGALSFPFTLSGSQFGGQGSPTGFGSGFLTLNPANNSVTVQLNTMGLGPNVTGAGLFNNGVSTQSFFDANNPGSQGGFDQNGNFTRTMTLSQQAFNQILTNPSAFTFGVSTGEFPNGAISGRLMNAGSFGGTFSGANVVGSTGASGGGGAFSANIVPNASGNGSTLAFSFTPTGIGNSFTGLSLNQGGVGANGGQFISLSNGGTLTNGRFTGSVQLTNQQAQALLSNPGNFNLVANTAQFPAGAVRAQFGMAQNEIWFPVAGSVRGALGNQWTTDIRVYNASGVAPATVLMELFPAGGNNVTTAGAMNALGASAFTVNARATNTITSGTSNGGVLSSFNGIGALRITSDQPIIAVERIYDANAGSNAAAAAQPIFGRTLCDATARGVLIGIANTINGNANNGNGVHSNIGFFNPNPVTVSVQVNVGSGQGAALGPQQTLTLQPFQLVQMPLVGAPGSGLVNAASDIADAALTFQATAPLFAFSSVINNASGDTHVTFARPDVSQSAVAQPDIAAIVVAANQGEVTEGQIAAARASSSLVQQFAQQMISDHGNALAQAQTVFASAGITPSGNSPTAQFLQAQTSQDVATLNTTSSGAAFDRTYMQMQLVDHQKVLQMLDTMLIPSAAGSPLLPLLQQMRATVAQHLASAQTILSQIP